MILNVYNWMQDPGPDSGPGITVRWTFQMCRKGRNQFEMMGLGHWGDSCPWIQMRVQITVWSYIVRIGAVIAIAICIIMYT